MRRFITLTLIAAGLLAGAANSRAQQVIELGMLTTTHVVFTSDLQYVDISSPEKIVGKVVDASKNMLALKAREEFAFTTTISALEANGTLHTFYVRYNPDPSVLVIDTRVSSQGSNMQVNTQIRPEAAPPAAQSPSVAAPASSFQQPDAAVGRRRGRQDDGTVNVTEQPAQGITVSTSQTSNFGRVNAPTIEEVMRKGQEIYHITDKSYRLEASVINVYAYSDLTYIIISVVNNSDIGYEAGDAQFTIESRASRRQLTTDKSVWPKSSYGTLSCAPNSRTMVGYTIPKLTLQKNEMLKIYIYEKGGTRNLFLTLNDKDVNYAVSPI